MFPEFTCKIDNINEQNKKEKQHKIESNSEISIISYRSNPY